MGFQMIESQRPESFLAYFCRVDSCWLTWLSMTFTGRPSLSTTVGDRHCRWMKLRNNTLLSNFFFSLSNFFFYPKVLKRHIFFKLRKFQNKWQSTLLWNLLSVVSVRKLKSHRRWELVADHVGATFNGCFIRYFDRYFDVQKGWFSIV